MVARSPGDRSAADRVPATYVKHWLGLLAARGIARDRVLAGVSLDGDLDDPLGIPLDHALALLLRGVVLAKDPALALELGLGLKATSHGWYSLALLACKSLREAIEIGTRYLALRAPPLPRVRSCADADQVRFPASWLERELKLNDSEAKREAIGMLEAASAKLRPADDLVSRLSRVLAVTTSGCPGLDEAAGQLGVSRRTLRRHLRRSGTRFQALKDDARKTPALAWSRRHGASIPAGCR